MDIVVLFRLIRWKNLFLIIYTQVLIHFVIFRELHINIRITDFDFYLICLATILIAAAGNVINDIGDVNADRINKPGKNVVNSIIELNIALTIYKSLNALGLFLGAFVAMRLDYPISFFYFAIPALLLYFYSKRFKSIPLFGNFIIAILTAFSIVLLGFFELPTTTGIFKNYTWIVLFSFAFFAFLLNLCREIIKDIMDMKGDFNSGIKTLPILIGIHRSRNLVVVLFFIVLVLVLTLVILMRKNEIWMAFYLSFVIFLPMLYMTYKLLYFDANKNFKNFSIGLKLIMFLGINAMLLYLI